MTIELTDPPALYSTTHTGDMPGLLAALNCSLAITTYQAGKVILIGSDGSQLYHLPRTFDLPMGLAVQDQRMALATRQQVVMLSNDAQLAQSYPNKPRYYDSLYVPRSVHFCGELNIHDMVFGEDGLVGVNTLFSCLFRLDHQFSFVPVWHPPFIDQMVSEDRCHLNGLTLAQSAGESAYVTALGVSNEAEGWRQRKLDGGVLMEVPSGEIVLEGLAMPHSPRLIDGHLFVLLSARGEVAVVDRQKGTWEVIQRVPGFARGLARYGDYLFVGMSKLRPNREFGDLPLAQEETRCGVAVIHLLSGDLVGQIEYQTTCEEIYDVQVLPGLQRPGILGVDTPMHRRALSIPKQTFWAEEQEEAEADEEI